MRLVNVLIAFLPFIIALVITYFIGVRGLGIVLAYFVVLMMVVSFQSMGLFITYWLRGRDYEGAVLSRAWRVGGAGNYRIAVVIPVFNEPPGLVAETATISKAAVGELGDVYVLDDSTREDVRRGLDYYAEELGFKVFRRGSRRGGFKLAPLMIGLGPLVGITTTWSLWMLIRDFCLVSLSMLCSSSMTRGSPLCRFRSTTRGLTRRSHSPPGYSKYPS